MNLQFISDNRGKTTGVFIPIEEWEGLKSKFKGLEEVELEEQSKYEILQGLLQAVEEITSLNKVSLKHGMPESCSLSYKVKTIPYFDRQAKRLTRKF